MADTPDNKTPPEESGITILLTEALNGEDLSREEARRVVQQLKHTIILAKQFEDIKEVLNELAQNYQRLRKWGAALAGLVILKWGETITSYSWDFIVGLLQKVSGA